jgi:hypothetical protein
MKRIRRLDFFTLGISLIITAIEIGLGINLAFVTHALIAPVFPGFPLVSVVVSIVVGLLFGLGASGLFAKLEDAIQAITYYAEFNEEKPIYRLAALWTVVAALIIIDVLGLLYRLQFLQSAGAGWLVGIGIFLAVLPILLGRVRHPMTHKPADLITEQIIERFDREHVTQLYGALDNLPLEIRQLAYNGDVDAALVEANKYLKEQDEKRQVKRSYVERRKQRAIQAPQQPHQPQIPQQTQVSPVTAPTPQAGAQPNFPQALQTRVNP